MNEPGKAPVCYECVWQTNRQTCIRKVAIVDGDGEQCASSTPIEEPEPVKRRHRNVDSTELYRD
jgi:hypothetical protein